MSSLAAAAAKLRISKDATGASTATEIGKNMTKKKPASTCNHTPSKSNNARQSTLRRADNINKQSHRDNNNNNNKRNLNNHRDSKSHGSHRQNNLDYKNVRSTTTRESDRGTPIRGRGHNNNNNNSRGKKNQGKGRNHNQPKQHHRGNTAGITKRIDGDVIRFEYEIDDDDDDDDNDGDDNHELQQPFSSPSKGSNHQGRLRRENDEPEGRILDMKASKRLINNALGIRNQKNTSTSSGAPKSNDRFKKQSLSKNMGTNTTTASRNGYETNSSQQTEEIKQQNKVVLLSKGEIDPSAKKSPMKRWADDDDDEDY